MGLPLAFQQAFRLSAAGYLFSSLLVFMLPSVLRSQPAVENFIWKQLAFGIGGFIVFLGWELNHNLHQVLNTKRFVFAPPKGSAAAETNPSEPLLAVLDESTQKSLLQYIAHLDLCMVCERNVDTWRRAAFFEETGETYKRVVASCIRPIEQLTLKLSERLESSSVDHSYNLSHQLRSSGEGLPDSSMVEAFYDFQLCVWCARTLSSLTAHSHNEDRFGVAQLSGSIADVISTLMSALLAVETLMGKKTHLQSPNLIGPAGMKWATVNTGSKDSTNYGLKRRDSPLYAKAYLMADTLRTSIYEIVSVFHAEMLSSEKAGLLEKDWTSSSKPPYGTREILSQKLGLFLNFQSC
ncbi:hypothetical protein Leryth_020954 [Lithospermum erythrorhizon]|nr:hypothetical protein Leryth_020954 [Lithospermum erythrorhizon]